MALPPLSIKITADATNAKAGLKEVSAATKAADMAAEQYQSSLRKVDAANKSGLISQKAAASATMQAEASYESATRAAAALTGAQITVGRAANVAGAQIKSATGHTANLGAQFNDIGVMLAAGQSPLMLAMQQGTQINQVMAQMGGGKTALRGLGAAFLGIINPMRRLQMLLRTQRSACAPRAWAQARRKILRWRHLKTRPLKSWPRGNFWARLSRAKT